MPGIQVDGNDILAVYSGSQRKQWTRARSGGGPTLIECVTYRIMMHTTADDPKKYRSEEDVERWKARDPLLRYRKYLVDKRYPHHPAVFRVGRGGQRGDPAPPSTGPRSR